MGTPLPHDDPTLSASRDDLPGPDDVSPWDRDAQSGCGGPTTQPDPTPMVAFALTYATDGLLVFPVHTVDEAGRCSCATPGCPHAGKHPIGSLVPHGLHDATADRATILHWWSVFPDANIGLRTGAVSRVVVVDVDPADGGAATAAELEAAVGPWPDTWTAVTGGDGWHLYLRHPGHPLPNSTGRLGPGIDVRGDGGYVVAPPSRHASGRSYAWAAGYRPTQVALCDTPPWLIARLRAPDIPAAGSRGSARLAQDETIATGERNDRLMRLGARMRGQGMTASEIGAALSAVNAARCCPPLAEAEVARIAVSVARYAPESPTPTLRIAGMELPMRRGRRRRG